jgi:4-amino-4-deoxy-L-arabinose transferase-like glycosyltransferase
MLFFFGREVLSTRFGAYSIALMGLFDFMPLVQSRYATIDTISALFIGLMFLFAFRYVREQHDEWVPESKPKLSFLPLCLLI